MATTSSGPPPDWRTGIDAWFPIVAAHLTAQDLCRSGLVCPDWHNAMCRLQVPSLLTLNEKQLEHPSLKVWLENRGRASSVRQVMVVLKKMPANSHLDLKLKQYFQHSTLQPVLQNSGATLSVCATDPRSAARGSGRKSQPERVVKLSAPQQNTVLDLSPLEALRPLQDLLLDVGALPDNDHVREPHLTVANMPEHVQSVRISNRYHGGTTVVQLQNLQDLKELNYLAIPLSEFVLQVDQQQLDAIFALPYLISFNGIQADLGTDPQQHLDWSGCENLKYLQYLSVVFETDSLPRGFTAMTSLPELADIVLLFNSDDVLAMQAMVAALQWGAPTKHVRLQFPYLPRVAVQQVLAVLRQQPSHLHYQCPVCPFPDEVGEAEIVGTVPNVPLWPF